MGYQSLPSSASDHSADSYGPAFGYVKHYYEERGVPKRNCEIDRIVQGCVGVRRTTGQHPGGIIVLPLGENIYSFTPVQHPALCFP